MSNKKIGLWMCTALVVGIMIGSGVFLLPAALSPYGSVSMVGWVATSVGALGVTLSWRVWPLSIRPGRSWERGGTPSTGAAYCSWLAFPFSFG